MARKVDALFMRGEEVKLTLDDIQPDLVSAAKRIRSVCGDFQPNDLIIFYSRSTKNPITPGGFRFIGKPNKWVTKSLAECYKLFDMLKGRGWLRDPPKSNKG